MRDAARLLASFLVLALAAAACARPPEPRLLRRHASLQVVDTTGTVDVAVFSTAVAVPRGRMELAALSRSAQSELIRSVSEKTGSLDAFLGVLSPPPDETGGGETDRTRHRRRLVVSAERRVHGPGARLQRLRVALGVDGARARFVDWDRFVTRHQTVEVGEARLRRSSEGGLQLDGDPRGLARELAGVELGSRRSATLDEQIPLRQRALSTGILRADSLVLLQEAPVGMDVSGNSVVEVEIDLADAPPRIVHRPGPLFDEGGRPLPPTAIRLSPSRLVHAPRIPGGLRATMTVDAAVRTVSSGGGAATLTEADDRVRLLRSRDVVPGVLLLPEEELRASVWEITDRSCRRVLHRRNPATDRAEALHFASADGAHRFRRWLAVSGAGSARGRTLLLGPRDPLSPASADSLRVRLLPLNWDPGAPFRCP